MGTTGQERGLSRRRFLGQAVAGGVALALPTELIGNAEAWTGGRFDCIPPFRNSMSISPFIEVVLQNVSLSDGTRTAHTMTEAQRLYNAHGATEVYARIATAKHYVSGDSDDGWDIGLGRARLARDLGMPFNPELGLFGTYGDGATYQDPPNFDSYPSIRLPAPWTTLTLEQMLPPMRQYAALVAKQILDTGVRVNYWDLGNEVENGISGVAVYPLFPTTSYQPPDAVDPLIKTQSVPGFVAMGETARIAFCKTHLWPYVAKLLAAARDGIRSVDRNAKFSTHISHFAQGTSATQLAFWEVSRENGYLPDLLGTSYYPTDGKTTTGALDMFAWFKDTATALGQKFNRQMFIAEYGYPSKMMPPPYPFNDPVPGYTIDEAGQHDFTRDLVQWGVESGRLAGLRPWAADYCSASGWQPMSWFDVDGKLTRPKPALHAIQDAVGPQTCPTGAALMLAYRGRTRSGALRIEVRSTAGILRDLTLQLSRAGRVLARSTLGSVGSRGREISLPVHAHLPPGHYRLSVLRGRVTIAARTVTL